MRISTNTYDEHEAERQKRELEAKLLLGIGRKQTAKSVKGLAMPWEEFRDSYRTLHLDFVREKSAICSESRLDIAERILKPRMLGDLGASRSRQRLHREARPEVSLTFAATGFESCCDSERLPIIAFGRENSTPPGFLQRPLKLADPQDDEEGES